MRVINKRIRVDEEEEPSRMQLQPHIRCCYGNYDERRFVYLLELLLFLFFNFCY